MRQRQAAFDRGRCHRRRVHEIDLGIHAAHAAGRVKRAGRSDALPRLQSALVAIAVVACRPGDERASFYQVGDDPALSSFLHDDLAGRNDIERKALAHLAALEDAGRDFQLFDAPARARPDVARIQRQADMVLQGLRVMQVGRHDDDRFQSIHVDGVACAVVGVGVADHRVDLLARTRQRDLQDLACGVDNRGCCSEEHRKPRHGLERVNGHRFNGRSAKLDHLEVAGTRTQHPDDVVKDVARHDTLAKRAVDIHPDRFRHLDRHFVAHEGLDEIAAHAECKSAVRAKLADVAVVMHHQSPGGGIPLFRRDLVADALAVEDIDFVRVAPAACFLVQCLGGRVVGRHEVVDEDAEALGIGHGIDLELLHLPEEHRRRHRKIVGEDEIRTNHQLVARPDRGQPGCAGEDFLGQGMAHGHRLRRARLARS